MSSSYFSHFSHLTSGHVQCPKFFHISGLLCLLFPLPEILFLLRPPFSPLSWFILCLRFTLNFIYTKESFLGSQAQARYLSSVLQWHPMYLSIKMLITPHYSLELFLRYSYKILEDMVLFYSSSFYFIVIFSSRSPIQFLAIGGAQ